MLPSRQKEFTAIASELATILSRNGVSFTRLEKRIAGFPPIDSRSALWSEVRRIIIKNGSTLSVGIQARWRYVDLSGSVCNACVRAIENQISCELDAQFGVSENADPHDWFRQYSPACELIEFLEEYLRDPDRAGSLIEPCSKGHVIPYGGYIVSIIMTFRDVLLEVDYYMKGSV